MDLAVDPFEDDLTRELPSALRTFTDLDAFDPEALEVTCEVAAADILEVEAPRARKTLELQAAAIVLFISCALAGGVGLAVGVLSSARDEVALADVRVPRIAVVTAAHEEVTEPPPTAPGKLVVVDLDPVTMIATPLAAAATAPPRPQPQPPPIRRSGFQRPSTLPRR